MAALALKAVALGADHIPDKVFESIPGGYFKQKERDREKRQAKERRRDRDRDQDRDRRARSEGRAQREQTPPSEDDGSDGNYYSDDEQDYVPRRRSHRANRSDRSNRSHYSKQPARSPSPVAEEDGDNYSSRPREIPTGGGEKRMSSVENASYPPPPRRLTRDFSQERTYSPARPQAFNPIDYSRGQRRSSVQRSGSRDEYYNRLPLDGSASSYEAANPYARSGSIPGRSGSVTGTSTPDYRPPAYDPLFPHLPSQSQPPVQPTPQPSSQKQTQLYSPPQSTTTIAPYNPADYAPSPDPWNSVNSLSHTPANNQVGPYTGPSAPPPNDQVMLYSPPPPPPGPQPLPQHGRTMPPTMSPHRAAPIIPPPPVSASYYDYSDLVPRHRSKSASRHGSRRHRRYSEASGPGRTPSSIRAKFEEYKRDPEKREVGVSALGALAGGYSAHEMDRRRERRRRYREYDDGYESY